jgi:uncharacterized secreted protein with C-terminal beta-propeller domain
MSARKRFARLGLFGGPVPPAARSCAPRRFHVERLEDRRMMNADNPLADGSVPPDAAASVVTSTASPSATELPDNFQSRAELRQWLIQIADQQWGQLFGQKTNLWGWGWGWGWFGDAAILRTNTLATAFSTNNVSPASTDSDSSTNTQVAGVDEADLVETDGEYLYVVSGKTLTIVKLGVGEELAVSARVQLDDEVAGMYLDGDRLALISKSSDDYYGWGGIIRPAIELFIDVDMAASQASQDDHAEEHKGPTTTVTLLDVSDRTAPALVKTTELDGRYIASRAVDGQLRMVLENGFQLPQPLARRVEGESEQTYEAPYKPAPEVGGELRLMVADYYYSGVMQEYEYETRDEYIDRVIDEMLDHLPSMREIGLDGEVVAETALVAAEGILRPEGYEFSALTTIVTIEMHGSGAVEDSRTVLGNSGATVYATADHLYLLTQSYDNAAGATDVFRLWQPTTKIWKFSFDAESHDVQLAARGRVDGTVLNQFAVDEHEGNLRIVTSGDWSQGQQLSVLTQTGKQLNVVGHVDGLAPGEVVQSVRFMGDRAFVVTFRQVDPLFTIDLSDPENPTVEGELKIPGYSEYLQPLDENHLIGIGRGANEATGFFEELQVSIFDVSDLDNPQLVHRYSFEGGRSTTTVATGDRWTRGDGDHHAVGYYADEQILTLPIYAADSFVWWNETDEEQLFEQGEGGVQVFRIDAEDGLVPAALIEHETLIHRTVLVGDHLFAISPGTVTAHTLDDPATAVAELELDSEAGFTPLVEYVAPAVETSVAVTAAPVADPAPSTVRGFRPSLRELYAVPQAPSLAAQFRSGRDAAITQLANGRTFGDVVVRQASSTALATLGAIDQAFDEPAESAGEESIASADAILDVQPLGVHLASQVN